MIFYTYNKELTKISIYANLSPTFKEKDMDIAKLHQANPPTYELVRDLGRPAVIQELYVMVTNDEAYWALQAAIQLEDHVVAKHAATIMLASGTYSPDQTFMAREYIKAQEAKLSG